MQAEKILREILSGSCGTGGKRAYAEPGEIRKLKRLIILWESLIWECARTRDGAKWRTQLVQKDEITEK